MRSPLHHKMDRDAPGGIDPVVEAQCNAAAMTVETLVLEVMPLAYFIIILAIAATVDAKAHVDVRGKQTAETQLPVEIYRGHSQPERQVGPPKFRIVVVTIGVERLGPLAGQRLVITQLNQAAGIRVNLGV